MPNIIVVRKIIINNQPKRVVDVPPVNPGTPGGGAILWGGVPITWGGTEIKWGTE